MTDDTEIDVDELRSELNQIKGAMGLHERHSTAFQAWPVYAVLVLLASLASQAIVTFELSAWGHSVAWFGLIGLGGLYEQYALPDYDTSGEAKPNLRVNLAAIIGYLLAVLVITSPLLDGVGEPQQTATTFAIILGSFGAYYLIVGSSLAAYYIRARDRYAFYVGGAWILPYAALLPRIEFLQEWGYAIFGVLFALHGVGSYVILREG